MFSPDGELMCCCSEQKIQWYLSRGLAELLPNDPTSIRLLFKPKGSGHAGDPYYLAHKENHCVVCGSTEILTKHHCVPHVYRKHFPSKLKESASHDVVLLCGHCHDQYETAANKFKKQIGLEYNVDCHDRVSNEFSDQLFVRGLARALVTHGEKIPKERQDRIRQKIAERLGSEVTDEVIKQLSEQEQPRYKRDNSWGKLVVEKIEDIDAFCRRWRYHFVETMKPGFLHEHWSPDRPSNCRVYRPEKAKDGAGKV
jgi:exonuclease 3'-5' domain-containing protein 2